MKTETLPSDAIAVIGLSGRFPGAPGVAAFWKNVRDGLESISDFSPAELQAAGVPPSEIRDPHYVSRAAILTGIEDFDAEFFRFSAREAESADPQQRVLLECAWEALEQAGYAVECDERIGVYVGAGSSGYYARHLAGNADIAANVGALQLLVGNAKDYFATRISYKLNLTGPSLTVGTACSTSLVAVHLACQSLLDFHSDLALAGGVSIQVPAARGYLYEEGGIGSPDGRCRPFDARAQGTLTGSGAGVVVLRRLEDAIAAGDTIHAVLLGSAINNDGGDKVGFTAPSEHGQAVVIADALSAAGISPDTIGYVEGHGTGTSLGDPIEVAALTRVFREKTARRGFCALGSVKSNIGHLDEAAGVAGLIKAIMALRERVLPPSLHFEAPNPRLELEKSPFYVPASARAWDSDGPRRAAVSSFGIGGTNAHVILEEAPAARRAASARPASLLLLSARTPTTLEAMRRHLAEHLATHPDLSLEDAAFTLALGRRTFTHRCAVACSTREEAVAQLRRPLPAESRPVAPGPKPLIFLFPGQGAQFAKMGADLYDTEPLFRETIEGCARILLDRCRLDLPALLFHAPDLDETASAQPALFAIEYALAMLLRSWGIEPEAMLGHSLGEYVAATLAGVFTLSDALALVAARGRLMQSTRRGAMLAVAKGTHEIAEFLPATVGVAAVNGPSAVVLSGAPECVATLDATLAGAGIASVKLHTSHAFHSASMDAILEPFRELLASIELHAPAKRYLSNVTGDWITTAQATDPAYWVRHLRETVQFGRGVDRLCELKDAVWIEVGPGRTLTSLLNRHPQRPAALPLLPSKGPAYSALISTLGDLWSRGVAVDWTAFYQGQPRGRIPLPTYPFERRRYWVEPAPVVAEPEPPASLIPAPPESLDSWFHAPCWRPISAPAPSLSGQKWAVISDASGLAEKVAAHLQNALIWPSLNHDSPPDGHLLFLATPGARQDPLAELLAVIQRLDASPIERRLVVVTASTQAVGGHPVTDPECALLWGAMRTVAKEYANLTCSCLDLEAGAADPAADLLASLPHPAPSLAARAGKTWEQRLETVPLPASVPLRLREHGAYLITGGLGSMGLAFAEYLVRKVSAHVVLLSRTDVEARPPAEAARLRSRLAALNAAGGSVHVIAADVSAPEQLGHAIHLARERFGEIHGVIHAAGVLGQTLVRSESPAGLRPVLAPKVRGTHNLLSAFADRPLDFLILCSSLASLAPVPGQYAYGAANAFLDAVAHQRAAVAPGLTVSIDWGFWQELGIMETARLPDATKEAVRAEIREHGWENRGLDILDRILRSETPPQIVVTPTLPVNEEPSAPKHPALQQCLRESDERSIFSGRVSSAENWWVREHRVGDTIIMPGAAYLDLALSAFWHEAGKCATELSDVLFVSPMLFAENEAREIRVVLDRHVDGCQFRVFSETAPDRWQEHARGGLRQISASLRSDPVDLSARTQTLRHDEPPGFRARIENFGPHWRNVRSAVFGPSEGLARFALDENLREDAARFALHPALFDTATGFLAFHTDYDALLPFSFGRVRVFERLPSECAAHFHAAGGSASSRILEGSITDAAGREVIRIEDYALRRAETRESAAPPPENVRLELGSPGDLRTLAYRAAPRARPGPGEVEIAVRAAGLNFIEVLYALGLLPNFTGGSITFGQECAGVVVRVGEGVEQFRPGNEVIAYGAACFSLFTSVSVATVALKPPAMSFEEAAGLPAAFATAWYSLIELARLRRGERVLIHAAAGGVGLAAVRLAQWCGAEIFATAGSAPKRQFLTDLGIPHVLDSRSLAFADEIRALTRGQGIDVVLNSLSGEFIPASLGLLRKHGRFLELGKRDIFADTALGLGAFSNFISFFAVDMGPDVPGFAALWETLNAHLHAGDFAPAPVQVFPAAQAENAFEWMAQARHIGKVILSFAGADDLRSLTATPRAGAPWDACVPPPAAAVLHRTPSSTQSPLPKPPAAAGHERPPMQIAFRPAGSPTEKTIAATWEKLLGIAPIGVDDDFFELKGDSLLATQIMARLQRDLDVKLPLSTIFDHPTIASLAAQADARRPAAAGVYEEGVI